MLIVNQQQINLGNVKLGVPQTFTYVITNGYDSEVTINKLALSCHACTTAHISSSKLTPGGTATITAVFTPGSTGLASKNISVIYTIKEQRKSDLVLTFKAMVNG